MKNRETLNRRDFAGALGDIGIFIPLALGLIYLNGLNPFSVFFTGGIMYILSGFFFRHPLPVQPLKALAVTAMATGANEEMIAAATLLMGLFLLFFSFTNISLFINKLFSKPIIRGIQFGLGLMLIKKGIDFMTKKEYLFYGDPIFFTVHNTVIPVGLVVGTVALLFVLKYHENKKIPASLALIGAGILTGLFVSGGDMTNLAFKPTELPAFSLPDSSFFLPALFLLVIPQIPLTIGNSLYGTAHTAYDYFGKGADKTTPKNLALSLGIGNIFIGLLGGMPVCHGAGGLTAHYKFGARKFVSNLIIGTLFIGIGVAALFGPLSFLYLIPISIMGCLLAFTGLEHAMLMADVTKNRNDMLVVLVIGGIATATGNLFYGCMAGFITLWWQKISSRKVNFS